MAGNEQRTEAFWLEWVILVAIALIWMVKRVVIRRLKLPTIEWPE